MDYLDRIKWRLGHTKKQTAELLWDVAGKFSRPGEAPVVTELDADATTEVDSFWGEHTVHSQSFKTARQSEQYLAERAKLYPLFTEFMNLYGEHDGETVMDYGCGPGNDVVGFATQTRARKVIGVDISQKALNMARERLALHNVDPARVELIHSADTILTLPLADEAVDYIHCAGVLHHTSNPAALLEEFHRVLTSGGRACVMVYNRDSVWLHLYVAYQKLIIENAYPGLNAEQAFHKTTDVEADGSNKCPIARCYSAADFIQLCEGAGFRAEYVGGYPSHVEMDMLKGHLAAALEDERLAEEHKAFLRALTYDAEGRPLSGGKYAGVGGVYNLFKA